MTPLYLLDAKDQKRIRKASDIGFDAHLIEMAMAASKDREIPQGWIDELKAAYRNKVNIAEVNRITAKALTQKYYWIIYMDGLAQYCKSDSPKQGNHTVSFFYEVPESCFRYIAEPGIPLDDEAAEALRRELGLYDYAFLPVEMLNPLVALHIVTTVLLSASQDREQHKAEITNPVLKDYLSLPTSPTTQTIHFLLSEGKDILRRAARMRNTKAEITNRSGTNLLVTHDSGSGSVAIALSDPAETGLFAFNSDASYNMFVYWLIKGNEHMTDDCKIIFPLQDLVDIGLYARIEGARRGFEDAREILTSLKVRGEYTKGKKKVKVSDLQVLFPGATIEGSTCIVQWNPNVSFDFVAQYFTVLPKFYFSLQSRAQKLLRQTVYQARQELDSIQKRGYFTISFRTLQTALNLPDDNTPHFKRDVLQEIATAAERIHGNTSDIRYDLIYNSDTGSTATLNTGYAKVTIAGELLAELMQTKSRNDKVLDREKAKLEKAEIRAKAKAIQSRKKEP